MTQKLIAKALGSSFTELKVPGSFMKLCFDLLRNCPALNQATFCTL
jgi:hypothetical protein